MVTISREEYEPLKQKANVDETLIVKLVKGLEDILVGRIKLWKKCNPSFSQSIS